MEAALLWVAAVCVGASLLIAVVAWATKPLRKKKHTAELPTSVSLRVQGEDVVIPVPSADCLAKWHEEYTANKSNPGSCEASPGAGERLVPVSFFAPGCGLAGWSKYDNYWSACSRAKFRGFSCIVVSVADYEEAQEYIAEAKRREELLSATAELNNKGIALEKAGEIDAAISTYEQCIKLRYPAVHAFRRLCVLYRKRKDKVNEVRVIETALEVFPGDDFFTARLSRLSGSVGM